MQRTLFQIAVAQQWVRAAKPVAWPGRFLAVAPLFDGHLGGVMWRMFMERVARNANPLFMEIRTLCAHLTLPLL